MFLALFFFSLFLVYNVPTKDKIYDVMHIIQTYLH